MYNYFMFKGDEVSATPCASIEKISCSNRFKG
jgi:hypothetical protein